MQNLLGSIFLKFSINFNCLLNYYFFRGISGPDFPYVLSAGHVPERTLLLKQNQKKKRRARNFLQCKYEALHVKVIYKTQQARPTHVRCTAQKKTKVELFNEF